MVHGLLWLPLLIFFVWITWAGWNEYQKVETYKEWANQFERAKYDIYAALGQSGRTLTWGLPTRQGVINLKTAQLGSIRSIDLLLKGDDTFTSGVKGIAKKSEAVIQLNLEDGDQPHIPFTDTDMAKQWHIFLVKTLESVDPASVEG
ncbi:hypothetical protein [Leptothoe spongobia]|uniref:Uncharacterized protein n=1 Tax=Leptothoe spongobia TAU-MAC 1115 TaxID=1967444 RepID=A0A947DD37_9CYAN|nr:hypothetical protein [Leptothoe spongobia]MBT9314144.1 hypothetical protein [Leptothoe spongobia TAU-MAC 1115]